MIAGEVQGAAADVYDTLLGQVASVKYSIIELDDREKLTEVEGYLRCAQDLIRRQLLEEERAHCAHLRRKLGELRKRNAP